MEKITIYRKDLKQLIKGSKIFTQYLNENYAYEDDRVSYICRAQHDLICKMFPDLGGKRVGMKDYILSAYALSESFDGIERALELVNVEVVD